MFVGVKMLVVGIYKLPTLVSLGIICGILAVAVVASLGVKEEAEVGSRK
jgi:predicted tellurium resistance membrane protein TerC